MKSLFRSSNVIFDFIIKVLTKLFDSLISPAPAGDVFLDFFFFFEISFFDFLVFLFSGTDVSFTVTIAWSDDILIGLETTQNRPSKMKNVKVTYIKVF